MEGNAVIGVRVDGAGVDDAAPVPEAPEAFPVPAPEVEVLTLASTPPGPDPGVVVPLPTGLLTYPELPKAERLRLRSGDVLYPVPILPILPMEPILDIEGIDPIVDIDPIEGICVYTYSSSSTTIPRRKPDPPPATPPLPGEGPDVPVDVGVEGGCGCTTPTRDAGIPPI